MLHALRGLTHQALFDLAAKHLTVSTVGASAAQIRSLADVSFVHSDRARLTACFDRCLSEPYMV